MKVKVIISFVLLLQMNFFSLAAFEYVEQKSDVMNINESQLTTSHWIELHKNKQASEDAVLIDNQGVSQFNQQLIANNEHVSDPLTMPEQLTQAQLISLINQISSVPSSARFYSNGRKLGDKEFNNYRENLNLLAVATKNSVRWGLVVKRASLRTFPTNDRVLNSGMDSDLDRFQETAVFPGESVAVLHESKDKQWYLVRSYNYLAWVMQKDIALGDKKIVNNFMKPEQFLVVTGDKVFTTFVPDKPEVSEIQLDMGVKLPLMNKGEFVGNLYGQNPYASHIVQLPVRNKSGKLSFLPALIAKSQDINIGYLPFTKQNIIKQAFKFLGERYGWGHDYNARDCTGFVGEIYKTFGVLMPRNSGQQGKANYGNSIDFTTESKKEDKLAAIKQLEVGDLVYIPGHVVMYLGEDNGQPYVIHDVKGMSYFTEDNKYYKGTLNGVSVTPLLPLQLSESKSYIDRIYNIKQIRLNE
ncbi:SH3 domain-containing protein [Thalassotalea piscium]|uniref:Cell wall-associated NlpC family hydrolase n=1 Tax=Thalassotalea piscium TaxID=1230533 RepID=A0A7X0NFA8_9GAMM|nr:SH3 domain-containing protein [Thalassotalea piscium]MBB6542418.1 cell wall-associated NlpC family hydrolase [Thalassotalea piscium]